MKSVLIIEFNSASLLAQKMMKLLLIFAVSVTAHSIAPIQQAADGRILPTASAVRRHRHHADGGSSTLLSAISISVINLFASTTEPVNKNSSMVPRLTNMPLPCQSMATPRKSITNQLQHPKSMKTHFQKKIKIKKTSWSWILHRWHCSQGIGRSPLPNHHVPAPSRR